MSNASENLWPEINAPEIKSPSWIIRVQSSNLRQSTGGLLEGEVKRVLAKHGDLLGFAFFIIAPQLDRYSFELFRIWHHEKRPYPVELRTVFNPELQKTLDGSGLPGVAQTGPEEFHAYNQDAFVSLLRTLFTLSETRQVLDSLLALTNDRISPLESDDSLSNAEHIF
jgi:hypothetical protein